MAGFGPVLAERRLVDQSSGKNVRVSLGAPRPGTDGTAWECPFRIHGAGLVRVEFGYGEDSMQAVMTALESIRALLDESGLALGWKLGAGRDAIWSGETGFTRSIPIALGPAFRRRLERLVDGQIRQEVDRLERRSTRKTTTTAKKARQTPPPRKSRKAR
jgi:hypothetical protein